MLEDSNKENIAEGLFQLSAGKPSAPSDRRSKKSRSLSMGPTEAAKNPLKEDFGNRRKSMMPAVKSILSANNSENDAAAKRKAARRKSLANRRVSFAPEATLHTWDVIEYMRDATSSSASSENERRASMLSEGTTSKSPDTDASSPNNDIDRSSEQLESQADQEKDRPQKKRRRSSGIPPLNFNHPDDALSSSPNQENSPLRHDSDGDTEEDDMGDATMDLDDERSEIRESGESTASSARLDAALRQAEEARQANTQVLSFGSDGDQTMELVNDEITSAFQPFFHKNRRDPVAVRPVSLLENQENVDPFSSVPSAMKDTEANSDDGSGEDATMDVTMAIGGIIRQQKPSYPSKADQTKTLKRLRSSMNLGAMADSSGSPIRRPSTRRSLSRRPSYSEDSPLEDGTMDLTMAIGGIRQTSAAATQPDSTELSLLDATMDFTVAVGSIKDLPKALSRVEGLPDTEMLEDLSMELTENLGKSLAQPVVAATPSPARRRQSPRKSILPPTITIDRPSTPKKGSGTPASNRRSNIGPSSGPRGSVRKSPSKGTNFDTTAEILRTPEQANVQEVEVEKILETPAATESTPARATMVAPQESPTPFKPALKQSISDTLKLLLTPRKEILPTPTFAPPVSQPTPKRSSPRKGATPKRKVIDAPRYASPQKRVRIEVAEENKPQASDSLYTGDDSEVEPISLQDFLNMTNIRFMDLTTTKRRATGFPGAEGMLAKATGNAFSEEEPTMENNVAAAAAIVPMLSMYQHSCHEMKSYISSGRTEIKDLEVTALETQPPLFHDYANATVGERSIIDTQLRDLKTNTRLQSKSGWHMWRSQLLNDLKNGLMQTADGLSQDDKLLVPVETAFQEVLPKMTQEQADLEMALKSLEQRKRDDEENSGADLEEARERLVSVESELRDKQQLLEQLRSELEEKSSRLDDARSWKTETVAAIKEAERVSEECRGWSTTEVLHLNNKIKDIEAQHQWSLVSASGNNATLKHKDLHLSIHPQAWASNSRNPPLDAPNAPVSLIYVGNEETDSDTPSATVRRFFLQLLRAHAHSLPQCRTHVSRLLTLIKNGWELASRLLTAVRALEISSLTDVHILGDEKFGIEAYMLLPALETKICARFAVDVRVNPVDAGMEAAVNVSAQVVYGERYDEPKMASFLHQFVPDGKVGSDEEARKWAAGLDDLRDRLISTGRKGARRV